MSKVFLVQSVDTDTFYKLAKKGICVSKLDIYTLVATNYACVSYREAIDDCRRCNRKQTYSRYFVREISCY